MYLRDTGLGRHETVIYRARDRRRHKADLHGEAAQPEPGRRGQNWRQTLSSQASRTSSTSMTDSPTRKESAENRFPKRTSAFVLSGTAHFRAQKMGKLQQAAWTIPKRQNGWRSASSAVCGKSEQHQTGWFAAVPSRFSTCNLVSDHPCNDALFPCTVKICCHHMVILPPNYVILCGKLA